MKVYRSEKSDGTLHGWLIACPACRYPHLFDARWKFNEDVDRPTFTPSMLVNGELYKQDPNLIRCHSFVTEGRIQFLSDSNHSMAGQTVDLLDFTWD